MSLVRTGNAPGQWRDEGPAPHVSLHFRVGGALVSPSPVRRVIGQRVNIPTPGEVAREKRRRAEYVPVARPVCGVVMAVVGEPCARRPGHADSHRSRAVMDADARGRWGSRKPWEAVR